MTKSRKEFTFLGAVVGCILGTVFSPLLMTVLPSIKDLYLIHADVTALCLFFCAPTLGLLVGGVLGYAFARKYIHENRNL